MNPARLWSRVGPIIWSNPTLVAEFTNLATLPKFFQWDANFVTITQIDLVISFNIISGSKKNIILVRQCSATVFAIFCVCWLGLEKIYRLH